MFPRKTDEEREADNFRSHDLVKTGDPETLSDSGRFPAYCDSHGAVVLAYCRRCRGGEIELYEKSCLDRLLVQAVEREAKMTPLERAISQLEQRRSWVTAEMRMNDDASPNGVTKDEAYARLANIAPEYIVLDELKRLAAAEAARNKMTLRFADGTERKAHYGAGRQPIDDIKDVGWYAEFCAGNVLKYLRRTKDPEHSIHSARVYYDWLNRATAEQRRTGRGNAIGVLNILDRMLTAEERATVQEGLTVR